MNRILIISILIILVQVASAQTDEQSIIPPTKLEELRVKSGSIIIRGYTNIGKIEKRYGSIVVEAREIKDAQNLKDIIYGIEITVYSRLGGGGQSSAFIEENDIKSLLEAIDYILGLDPDVVTDFNRFNITYKTKGDFEIIMGIGVGDDRILIAAGSSTLFINESELKTLVQYITEAQSLFK